MANVQCAGLPYEQQGPHSAQLRGCVVSAKVRCAGKKNPALGGALANREWPCGWKGERKGGNRNLGPLPGKEFYAELHRRMTELPCPWCGGRVELIEEPS